ncbi:MAG: Cobalt-precorrin-2 C(20)-methyltransferase [Syntrophus sp. SKADARSKE-3]|nr:Cobalt-precorrin-2 C(20)-methyltransferase [Syntrophus sp. SKADARSKE-3]
MTVGTLYGIGIGPGDPELITVKGATLLSRCCHVFVPKARTAGRSVALSIAECYIGAEAQIHELLFPMTADRGVLSERWQEAARQIAAVLETGMDACFLTLGDPLLYSTYIYLLRGLKGVMEDARVVTVPGIMAFSAAAALSGFTIGEGKSPVTVVPTADDVGDIRRALSREGTVVLMKIGNRLHMILDLLEEANLVDDAVFVSHVGMAEERLETNLHRLREAGEEAGYLSIILVHVKGEKER